MMTAIGPREGTSMDKDKAVPAEQEPQNSKPGDGSTIPKSKDGVWATSTPGKSTFEPEEDTSEDDDLADDSGAKYTGGPADGP